jgi:hypothetical protein
MTTQPDSYKLLVRSVLERRIAGAREVLSVAVRDYEQWSKTGAPMGATDRLNAATDVERELLTVWHLLIGEPPPTSADGRGGTQRTTTTDHTTTIKH